jgi:hypothetical protein
MPRLCLSYLLLAYQRAPDFAFLRALKPPDAQQDLLPSAVVSVMEGSAQPVVKSLNRGDHQQGGVVLELSSAKPGHLGKELPIQFARGERRMDLSKRCDPSLLEFLSGRIGGFRDSIRKQK